MDEALKADKKTCVLFSSVVMRFSIDYSVFSFPQPLVQVLQHIYWNKCCKSQRAQICHVVMRENSSVEFQSVIPEVVITELWLYWKMDSSI